MRPTPAEALKLRIRLPWEGKVRNSRKVDLQKELFLDLIDYGLNRHEIQLLFGMNGLEYQAALRKMDIQPGVRGYRNPNRQKNWERKAGQKAEAMNAEEEPIELTDAMIDEKIAEIDAKLDELQPSRLKDMPANELPKVPLETSTPPTEPEIVPTKTEIVDIVAQIQPPDLAKPGDINGPPEEIAPDKKADETEAEAMRDFKQSIAEALSKRLDATVAGNIEHLPLPDATVADKPHLITPTEAKEIFTPEDGDGLNYQDRHFLGIDRPGPAPEPMKKDLSWIEFEIKCNAYSMSRLLTILENLPLGANISGNVQIRL